MIVESLDLDGGPLDFQCSIIARATDTATQPISFREALAGIREGRWSVPVKAVRVAYEKGGKKAADTPKKALPGILFSGLFRKRSIHDLDQHSGLICVDLDNLGLSVAAVKEQIAADPHTLAAFVSPTGAGLKVIFRCDPAKPHADAYHAAEQFVTQQFGLEIDHACKDVCRICFVSHDPELFEAEDATPLPAYRPPVEHIPQGLNPRSGLELTPGDDYDNRGDLRALLLKHQWAQVGKHGWRRPDKTDGISATFDKVPGRFYVFSSSTQFEDGHTYRPWHVYAILEHGGDYHAAARELGKQGFGNQKTRQQENMERLAGPTSPPTPTVHRTPFSFQIPPANDRSILLGNRYLNRGDGMVVSSSSGMGKSSMSHQMASDWALGLPFFGIKPNGALKILIVQSEDSDGDIAEVWQSLKHVRNYTETQIAALNQNIRIISEKSKRGVKFLNWLKEEIIAFSPDLVMLNPLQAYIDGDVTDSKDLGFFLREGLNGMNADSSFGWLIVHHTTKPATGKDRSDRQWHEVMYDMAGGAEIINWARGIISLRALPEPGKFKAVLAKRGRRAGVTKPVPQGAGDRLEIVTQFGLQHAEGYLPGTSTSVICWEPYALPAEEEPKRKSGGAPQKYPFEKYRALLPKKTDKGKPQAEIGRACVPNGVIPPGTLSGVLARWEEEGDLEAIRPESGPTLYRAAF